MNRSIWLSNSQLIEKPWGYERQWTTMLPLGGKVLYINSGAKTSMKMFDTKDEVLFVQQGELIATIADENIFSSEQAVVRQVVLTSGSVLNIQAGCPYQLEASKSGAIVIEISNQQSGCTRIEDDHGRAIDGEKALLIKKKLERLTNDCN